WCQRSGEARWSSSWPPRSARSRLRDEGVRVLKVDGAQNLLDERLLQRVDRAGHGAAGRVLVAAAAELLRDRADIDVAFRAHADPVGVALRLLEEDHRLDLL